MLEIRSQNENVNIHVSFFLINVTNAFTSINTQHHSQVQECLLIRGCIKGWTCNRVQLKVKTLGTRSQNAVSQFMFPLLEKH